MNLERLAYYRHFVARRERPGMTSRYQHLWFATATECRALFLIAIESEVRRSKQ